MKPGELGSFLGCLFLPPVLAAVVLLLPRACEIGAALLVLLAAVKAGGEVVRGRPDSPLGRRGALWVATLFVLVGVALLAGGFFPASFLAAGYISLTLFGLAAATGTEFWGTRSDAASGRFVLAVLGLIGGAYAAAGALGWSPADDVDVRSFATFPGPILVVLVALFTANAGLAVWIRGLELRGGRWVRNRWTKSAAAGLWALAAAIVGSGLMGLALLR